MLDTLVGVLWYTAFFLLGWGLSTRLIKSRKSTEKDLSVCSCTHKYSMHNDKGRCQVAVIKRVNSKDREFACACVRYDGVPPATFF